MAVAMIQVSVLAVLSLNIVECVEGNALCTSAMEPVSPTQQAIAGLVFASKIDFVYVLSSTPLHPM